MASTYTGLGTQLMATGENAGTWGTKTNTNLNILEQIAGGYIEVDVSSTPTTLSVSDGSTGAALAHRCITFTETISENTVVTIPLDVQTFYIIKNSVSGSYSVQFKYVTGSGSSVTWASGDTGTKIVYAAADDATNPNIVDATSAFVTATSTTTLTNKTLTSPKIGTSILDTNGNELALLTATGSAVNEFTIANAATTAGPTLSSTGGDSNIDINITPKGTGNVVLAGDTVAVGDSGAAATLTSNGAGTLTVTTGGATDLVLSTNSGSSSGTVTITDAADGNIAIAPNGAGEVVIGSGSAAGDITTSGAYDLILDTNSGTNAGNITLVDGANGNIEFTNNGTGVVKFNDAAYYPEADLTFDASQDWDVQASPVAKVTLTANVTFDAPSNPTTGQFISILCIQDGGGSNTIAWNAVFEFAGDESPTATTTGDKGDLFSFRYNGAKWLCVGTTLDLTLS